MALSVLIPRTVKVTIAVTNTAQKLFGVAVPRTNSIKMNAKVGNATVIYYGDSSVSLTTSLGNPLIAGASTDIQTISLISTESLFVSGTAGDVLNVFYLEQK